MHAGTSEVYGSLVVDQGQSGSRVSSLYGLVFANGTPFSVERTPRPVDLVDTFKVLSRPPPPYGRRIKGAPGRRNPKSLRPDSSNLVTRGTLEGLRGSRVE